MVSYNKVSSDVSAVLKYIRHKHYSKFKDAKIITLMRSGGKWNKHATISRVSSKHRLAGIDGDYVLTINTDSWKAFSSHQRKALIDHELYHIVLKKTKKGKSWRLRHHDVEEFIGIVKRYGAWAPNLKEMQSMLLGK